MSPSARDSGADRRAGECDEAVHPETRARAPDERPVERQLRRVLRRTLGRALAHALARALGGGRARAEHRASEREQQRHQAHGLRSRSHWTLPQVPPWTFCRALHR